MGVRARGWLFCAALCALLPSPRASGEGGRGPSSIHWDDGARAPADAWLQDDGCAARTGATETAALTGPREVAWKFEVKGDVEGEPLAWRGKTFVVERAGAKRVLHVLSTATGVERYRQEFTTALPLAPCVQEGRILLRTTPRTLQGFAVGDKALTPRWTVTAKTSIGPAAALRDEVYVVVDGTLQRRTYGSPAVAWPQKDGHPVRVEGAPAAGGKGAAGEVPRPSARGQSVFLATGTRLVEVARDDGRVLRTGDLPAAVDPASSRVVVGLGDVLVQTGKTFKAGGGGDEEGKPGAAGESDTVRFELGSAAKYVERRPLRLPAGIASLGRDWVGLMEVGAPPLVLGLLGTAARELDEGRTLANKDSHSEYLAVKTPPTAAGDVAILGGRMFDASDYKVLDPTPIAGVSRVVPLADRLLVVESRNKVVAWRRAGKQPDVPPLLPPAAEGAEATPLPAAHALVEDGRVVAGPFAFDAKAGLLRAGTGKAAQSWPVSSVRAVTSDEAPTRLLLCARPQDAAWAVAALARAGAASELLSLVTKAVEAKDPGLARRLQTAAAERGALEADVQKGEKAVAALEAAGGDRDDSAASAVEERLKALEKRDTDALLEAASSLPEGAPVVYGTALVRAVVAQSPYHSGATEWVRSHLPEGLSPPGFKDLADWLDFLDLRATATVRIFGPRSKIPDDVGPDVATSLEQARKAWRKDLVGFLNGSLLVVSPPEHPAAIAQCLTLGRIVSETLDAAFSSVGPRRSDDMLLVLHLFPNKAEYLAAGSHGESFGNLENTAGHYSPSENVTRIFWPSGGDGDQVPGVYCHELTHHWVGRRRPKRSGTEDPVDHAGGPGYWVVEGIADFVKDFTYDTVAREAEPLNPRANYADVVAGLPAADTYPWANFLTMTQADAYSGDHDKKIKVRLRQRMGIDSTFDPVNVWYAQSAATTAYLYLAENGKYRSALLTFLYDHYAGTSPAEGLLATIGLSADELGAKVVAWCRSLGVPPK